MESVAVKVRLLSLALALLLTIDPSCAKVRYSTVKVSKVIDGDSFQGKEVSEGHRSRPQKIRLVCIDAPELDQKTWGKRSAQALRRRMPVGSIVRVKSYSTDIYGRILAEVFDQQRNNIALSMLTDGMAVLYPHRDRNVCDWHYTDAEEAAKEAGRGVWSDPKFVLPSKFRRRQGRRRLKLPRKSLRCRPGRDAPNMG